jgi:hypothetical protein
MECLDSMLLQHENGVLRIFPVWPTDKDAMFKRLLAKGALEVSSEMINGAVPYVDITSEKGGELTMQIPWPSAKPSIARINPKTRARIALVNYKLDAGNMVFTTKPGERYLVTPKN